MEKNHAMTFRRLISSFLLTIFTTIMVIAAPLTFAGVSLLDVDVDLNSDSNSDLQDECEGIDETLAASLGCDSSDKIIDFTEYTGGLDAPDASGYDDTLTESGSAREFIQTIVNFALSFLGLVATVMIIYGGIMYVTSRGDEEMAGKGKKTISYSVVGILIILGSFALVNTLIGAGGGGSSSSDLGNGSDGTTITEAGADFDVEEVLSKLENVVTDYIDLYSTYIAVSSDIQYANAIPLPLYITVDADINGIDGFFTSLSNLFEGEGWSSTDNYEFYDDSWLQEYASDQTRYAQGVQSDVDSLSLTYESAQNVIDYLRSGSSVYGELGYTETEINILAQLLEMGVPIAKADDLMDYLISEVSEQFGERTCSSYKEDGNKSVEVEYTDEEGLFANTDRNSESNDDVYTFTVTLMDTEICDLIEDMQTQMDQDYQDTVDDLVDTVSDLELLFDTIEFDDSDGSKLPLVSNAFDEVVDRSNPLDGNGCKYYPGALSEAKCKISSSTVSDVIAAFDELYTLVQNVNFVAVVMSASAVTGNAPLIVTFDVLGTEDPSGDTVGDSQIYWDLDGDSSYAEVTGDDGVGSVDGTTTYGQGDSVSVTYDEEGTYRARVVVVSSDPDIAAGLSEVTIVVEPPKSQIYLEAYVGTEDPTVLADTRTATYPNVNVDDFKVTMTEAQDAPGVIMDACSSLDGDDNDLIYIEWDFGDNETAAGDFATTCEQEHQYGVEGSYDVSLTVTDQTGEEDRKYFNLHVASPAARMSYSPDSGEVGTEFTFDGSGSSADIGTIVSYDWSVFDETGNTVDEDSGSTFTTSIDSPGLYDVYFTVTDSEGSSDTVSTTILVESQTPVATFSSEIANSTEPATVEFDAGDSYDPDEEDTLTYEWDFDGEEGVEYDLIEIGEDQTTATVQYLETGDYFVVLTVCDQHEDELQKCDTFDSTISITSILDVDLDITGDVARNLEEGGTVEVNFTAYSEVATALEIDYGDGETDFTESITGGEVSFTHTYSDAGVMYATLTAIDDDENTNSITRRVYIGAGDTPIAVLSVTADDENIGYGDTLTGSIKTKFTFTATDSVNIDGTNNSLEYSWNFGDGTISSQSSVTHVFDEKATYEVSLTVKDAEDPTLSDETTVAIEIEGIDPEIRGITITPTSETLETPVKVNVEVDAVDDDGSINYVKAWYYDLDNSAEQLGTVISETNSFTLTLNTNGEEGDTLEYGFAVEVTDNDNQTVSSIDELDGEEIPTLEVTNGPNKTPTANFSVDRTNIFVGDEIVFSSTSEDPDGEIVSYWWDVEGDGFFNNDKQEESSLVYTFTDIYTDGVEVQLKVEDDSGAIAYSDTVKIYVDSSSEPPEAAFLADIAGTTVSFTDNSTIDKENGAELQGLYWDFDTDVDSDGDGDTAGDFDSFESDPVWVYDELGTYNVSLTVVDSAGQTDTVTREIDVLDAEDPVAYFSYTVDDLTVEFKNETETDEKNGVELRSYIWDFDTNEDSDGDTETDNDADSSEKHPTVEYSDYGFYEVLLTVEDTFGQEDTYSMTVEVPNPSQPVIAYLTTIPQANSLGQIVLENDGDEVSFFFDAEEGSGDFTFKFDKNIFYDTDGDGVRENDVDYETNDNGSWDVAFYKSYGQIVVKLTVTDNKTGESDVATVQVVFESTLGGANLFNATPNEMLFLLLSTMFTAAIGVSLVFRYNPLSTR